MYLLVFKFILNFIYWVEEYSVLFYYFLITLFIIGFLWVLVLNLSYSVILYEKASQYECGFEPFGFNSVFDLQYFLIGLLYLVFDVELVLVIPWLFGYSVMPILGLASMFLFLVLFIVGLIFEWKKNVLHWT